MLDHKIWGGGSRGQKSYGKGAVYNVVDYKNVVGLEQIKSNWWDVNVSKLLGYERLRIILRKFEGNLCILLGSKIEVPWGVLLCGSEKKTWNDSWSETAWGLLFRKKVCGLNVGYASKEKGDYEILQNECLQVFKKGGIYLN